MSNCMKSGTNGSCPHPRVEGSLFCSRHSDESSLVKTYMLNDANLEAEYERQGLANLYSLRGELQLIRTMINDRLNMATSDAERLVAYNQVGTWLGTVEKLVNSLNKLELQTSQVLSRETLMAVFKSILQVISEEIKGLPGHEKVIDSISVRVVPVIQEAANV